MLVISASVLTCPAKALRRYAVNARSCWPAMAPAWVVQPMLLRGVPRGVPTKLVLEPLLERDPPSKSLTIGLAVRGRGACNSAGSLGVERVV